jgi:hypothetical protein
VTGIFEFIGLLIRILVELVATAIRQANVAWRGDEGETS